MPADDLVLNVRQIAGYPPVTSAPPSSTLVLQLAGLGSAYASISAADLVATALTSGGAMSIGGKLSAQAFSGGSAQFSNAAVGMFTAQKACLVNFDAQTGTIGGIPIATTLDVAATVTSFNMRTGPITLWLEDILCAGGAPIYSPRFSGNPRAATPCPESNSTRLATTAYVTTAIANVLAGQGLVTSFNTREGAVVLTADDVTAANPPYAPLDSPAFSGNATAPTAAVGTSDGQIATTAFVMNAVAGSVTGVASFNTRTGAVVLTGADITGAGGALLASPVFTGTPQGPTATVGTDTAQLATTAYVMAAVAAAGYAPLASPAFAGTPTAPTAAPGVSTTQLATTAFVTAAIAAISAGVVSFNGRTGVVSLIANDISAAGGAVLASPAFTGNPTAPTASVGTNTTQIATTAFVAAAGYAPLNSPTFTGTPTAPTASIGTNSTQLATTAYVMAAIGAAGYAPINSPALTGTPTAPTAVAGTSTTQLATTAFVAAAIAAGVAGVSTFNGRAGAVTLIANDLSAAGGALLASPAFAGTPTAPTAAPGVSTTQLATTAFVTAAIAAASGVTSFNGRAGAVTLTTADVSAAGGPYLPLGGGTLTGTLNGTGANFSGQVLVTGGDLGVSARVAGSYLSLNGAPTLANGANLILNGGGRVSPYAAEFYWGAARTAWIDQSGGFTGAGAITSTNGRVFAEASQTPSLVCLVPGVGAAGLFLNNSGFVSIGATDGSGNPTANWWMLNYGAGNATLAWTGAYKPGGGTWTDNSDARIKTVESDYADGLDQIMALRPVVYTYKGNDVMEEGGVSLHAQVAAEGRRFVGLIAQEAEQVMPSLVTTRAGWIDGVKVDDLRALNTSELIFTLVNAVRTLAARVATLEAAA
jgi:hypothetical protein